MRYDELTMLCVESTAKFSTNYDKIALAEKRGDFAEVLKLLESCDSITKKRLVEEGMFDRMKSRFGQAKGAYQGAKQAAGGMVDKLKGSAYNAAGNLANKAANAANSVYGTNIDGSNNTLSQRGQALQQQGNQKIQQAKTMPNNAKIESYINSVSQTIVNDFTKLGMPFANPQDITAKIKQFIYDMAGNSANTAQQSQQNQQQPQQNQPVQESHEPEDTDSSTVDFTVPTWALSALIDGDYSGLTDEEERKVDHFIKRIEGRYGNAMFMSDNEDLDGDNTSRTNDIDDLYSSVAKVYIMTR